MLLCVSHCRADKNDCGNQTKTGNQVILVWATIVKAVFKNAIIFSQNLVGYRLLISYSPEGTKQNEKGSHHLKFGLSYESIVENA